MSAWMSGPRSGEQVFWQAANPKPSLSADLVGDQRTEKKYAAWQALATSGARTSSLHWGPTSL